MNSRGYVHADTKPNNIIVSAKGTVKIIDLGQSCPLGTIKERIQGTPDFIAPEQVNRRPLARRVRPYVIGAEFDRHRRHRGDRLAVPLAEQRQRQRHDRLRLMEGIYRH